MAKGAAATISSYRGKNRIQRLGKPSTVRANTNNVQFRLRGDKLGGFDRSEARVGLGGGVNISGHLGR